MYTTNTEGKVNLQKEMIYIKTKLRITNSLKIWHIIVAIFGFCDMYCWLCKVTCPLPGALFPGSSPSAGYRVWEQGYSHHLWWFNGALDAWHLFSLVNQTYMRFHRIHEVISTAMEERTPMTVERMMATSMATTVPWGYCAQRPHTGRQSEVFPVALHEKPSWHWSVLQLNNLPWGGWMLVSPCPPLPLPENRSPFSLRTRPTHAEKEVGLINLHICHKSLWNLVGWI